MKFLGIDLAWGDINETGLVALDERGEIRDAAWAVGVNQVASWIGGHADGDTLAFVDAPLVVTNDDGQRPCETQTGQRYGVSLVSANSTNLRSKLLAGVRLREELEARGWHYSDGREGPPTSGHIVSECYPYTTLVGAPEFDYTVRPTYMRKPKNLRIADFRPIRAAACDDLILRIDQLRAADIPVNLRSHGETARLLDEPSPLNDREYKHREDLIDAVLCAWTAALWWKHGLNRCQVLGASASQPTAQLATIIAPAKASQRC